MSLTTDLPASARRLNASGKRPQFRLTKTKAFATDWWVLPKTDLTSFLKVVGGEVEGAGSGAGTGGNGQVSRTIPLLFEEYPFVSACDVTADWTGWDTAAADWGEIIVRIAYETPDYDLDGENAFLTITGTPSTRGVNGPAGAFLVGGSRPESNQGVFIPGFDYTVTVHRLPSLNEELYQSFSGCVNNAAFRGITTGCLLYNGVGFQRTTTVAGVTTYEVQHQFSASRVRWNYEVGGGGGFVARTFADGSLPHPEVSFAELFA